MSKDRVLTVLAEGLILGTLVFATVNYGAVTSWSIVVLQWTTLALAIVTVLRMPGFPNGRLPGGWLNVPIILLLLAVAVSTTFSIYRYGSMRDALRIFDYILFFYLVAINLTCQRAVIRFLTTMVLLAAFLPFAGALQDWSRGAQLGGLGLAPESFKMGTFPNEDHFAAFLVLVLPVGLGLAAYLAKERRWTRFGGIAACLVLGTVSLMETLTRAAWLGIVFGLLSMLALLTLNRAVPAQRKLQAPIAAAAVLLILIGLAPNTAVEKTKRVVALGDTDSAMAFRLAAWHDSLRIIRDHALLGTGPRTFHLIYTQYRSTNADLPSLFVDYLHNDYLQYAVETGIPGAAAMVAVLVFFIYHVARRGAVAPSTSSFALILGVLGSVVAFATAIFYSFELYVTANGLLFWGMLAVGYRILSFSQIPDDSVRRVALAA